MNKVKIGLSGREIAKQAGMSPPSCLAALSTLESLNIVSRQRGGRDHFFDLNRGHFLVNKIIVPMLNQENKFKISLFKEINETLGGTSVSVFLFGSVARQHEQIESDLDICIVYKDQKTKKKLEILNRELGFMLHKKYGISLAPFYLSTNDFKKRFNSKKPPVPDIIAEGKLLTGKRVEELLYD
ncbi:MAG: nucleotidyltransferase domain-containing protein [Ignavibacteria bacterium]|nr:nucleotidyltransferase domain-containing protein [Ignavibacteria bacterium]